MMWWRRRLVLQCAALTACSVWLSADLALAQQDTEAPDADKAAAAGSRVTEEVVIKGRRKGDPNDVDARYRQHLRDQVFDEYRELKRKEEQDEWRSTLPTSVNDSSRVRWGYDAQAEVRMRRESELMNLQPGETKPATLVRFKF